MRKIIEWIKSKFKKIKKPATKTAKDILLNLNELTYDELSLNSLSEYSSLLTVLENQYEQILIDFHLGFISHIVFDEKMEEWKQSFENYRKIYLTNLNISYI